MALVDEFLHFLSTGEMATGAFAEDVFLDMNVPMWRVQLRGREAVRRSRAGGAGLHRRGGRSRPRACQGRVRRRLLGRRRRYAAVAFGTIRTAAASSQTTVAGTATWCSTGAAVSTIWQVR
jgi:hypothetical protein